METLQTYLIAQFLRRRHLCCGSWERGPVMAAECGAEGRELKEMTEEELWEQINDNRHRISLDVRPCIVIPYLRQARVLTEMDRARI